jgi:hypothetical protein
MDSARETGRYPERPIPSLLSLVVRQSLLPPSERAVNTIPTGDLKMEDRPIARCRANDVDAYEYPFYVKPAQGPEPAYIFLEDHVYNLDRDEADNIMDDLIRIEREQDLQDLGYEKNEEGIFILSEAEKPWLQGGKS